MLKPKEKLLKKRQLLGFLLIIIGIVIILAKVFATSLVKEPTLFYIGGSSEAVGQFPIKEGLIDYSVTLHNPAKTSFKISSVEPILTEAAQNILVGKVIALEEVKKLKAGEILTYTGKFQVNTSHLTEEEILKLIPLIKGYRVVYNQNKEIIISNSL